MRSSDDVIAFNREFDINDHTGYKPSFLPQQDMTNITNRKSQLSPLIECPCSSRIYREHDEEDQIVTSGSCKSAIATLADCTAAVANAGVKVARSVTVSNASMPSGCSMRPSGGSSGAHGHHAFTAIFNTASKSTKGCGTGAANKGPYVWGAPLAATALNCSPDGCLAPSAGHGCTGELEGQCTFDSAEAAKASCSEWDECIGTCFSATFIYL